MNNNVLYSANGQRVNIITIVIAIQLALWGSVGLDSIGISIPILRQIIGFVYITFIPGYLILKILKIRNIGIIRTLLYSTGLSLSILMAAGFILNTIGPLVGILRPISIEPIIILISTLIFALIIILYSIEENWVEIRINRFENIISKPLLLLSLLPLITVFGAYLMNVHKNNIVLLIIIIIILLIIVLILKDELINQNLYALVIFIISLTLLYHTSFISPYIWGWDIQEEYFFSNLVKINTIWDPEFMSRNCNAMLSLVFLVPIYSIILNMNLDEIFKIVIPLLFSFVPLGLYSIIQEQTNDKIAFYSCFYFVSYLTFYTEMLALARQQIAELYFVLILLTIFDRKINNKIKSLFYVIFTFSLTVSHYGLTYIFLFVIFATYVINFADTKTKLIRISTTDIKYRDPIKYLLHNKYDQIVNRDCKTVKIIPLNMTFIIMSITFAVLWYVSFSNSSSFNDIIGLSNKLYESIFSDFAKIETAQGLTIITTNSLPIIKLILKYTIILSQIFIILGLIITFLKRKRCKFHYFYLLLSLVFFSLCLAGIIVPYFASSLNTSRIFHVSLLILSPFCVIGGLQAFASVNKIVMKITKKQNMPNTLTMLSIFLMVFLLLNSGFAGEILKNGQSSIALTKNINYPYFMENDYYSASWLTSFKESNIIITDNYGELLLKRFLGPYYGTNENPFASGRNQHEKYWIYRDKIFDETSNRIINLKNIDGKIYYNGESQIYIRHSAGPPS